MEAPLEYPFNMLCRQLQEAIARMGFREPTEPQRAAIPLILRGENVLLIAPTGTGKTEAALLPIFDMYLRTPSLHGRGTSILYITPLRALNRDILRRMAQLAEELGINVAVRHGDTAPTERRRQALKPPDMLITTPETLQVLLPAKVMRGHLRWVRWVVVDEVHELVGDKRGVQLAVALERLKDLVGVDYQRVGLSATIGSPSKVKLFLQGSSRDVKVVYVPMSRDVELRVEAPRPRREDEEEASRLKVSPEVASRLRRIVELVEGHRSTLVFTNTREAAELLASRLKAARPGLNVQAHHGSLSREARVEAEEGLKEGEVKALVCTSSLELGIDVGHVDLVIQYMSPRQATRLVQRVGRSGHRAWEAPRGVIISMTADDVLESAVIAARALREELEDVEVHVAPLDVLAHQLVGIVLDRGSIRTSEAYELVRRAWPYAELSVDDFNLVVDFLVKQGFIRLVGDQMRPRPDRAWPYYYENVSVIPDTRRYSVVELSTRRRIGELDEEFVAVHGRPGLVFILAGRPWRLEGVEGDEVYVEEVDDVSGAIPSWVGELIPVPFEVAQEVGALRRRIAEAIERELEPSHVFKGYPVDEEAALRAWSGVKEQLASGVPLPTDRRVVVEGLGRMVVVHACLGSKVNEALGMLLAGLLSGRLGESVGYRSDPYRVLLIAPREVGAKIVADELRSVRPEEVDEALKALVKSSDVYRWRLLHVARRFGVVGRDVELSAARRLAKLLEGSVVERAAVEEVLVDKLDVGRLKGFLEALGRGEVELEVYEGSLGSGVSPMAYPIVDVATPHGILPPSRPVKVLVDMLRRRIMEREVRLVCMFCGEWESVRKVGYLPDEVRCPKCGAKFVAVTWRDDDRLIRVVRKHLRRMRLSREEQEALRRAQQAAGLVLAYGRRAVAVLAARGVGPQTASRILGRAHGSDDELYLDILEAERRYVRTRMFWS